MSDQPEPGSDGSNDDASEISSSGAEPASESGEAALPTSEVTSQLALLSAAATPYRFWVVQHNIAGGTKNHGAASALTYDEQRIAAIASDQHHTPDLVTMEEVCVSQYVAFQKNHPTWHVTFTHMLTNQASCAEGSDHGQGQMIASPWPWTNRTVTFLGYPDNGGPSGSKHFGMLCVDLQVGTSAGTRVVHSCVVHLRAFHRTAAENEADGNSALSDAEVRERQTSTIRSTLRQVITSTGHAVVITGDFNALPETPVLTNMYAPTVAGAGDFYEADQTDSRWQNGAPCGTADSCRSGEYTMDGGRKFDYAFYSSNRARDRVSGAPMDKGASDHRLYQAFADLSL
jgi:endonuclease/exonuclease/phosphatase family metal-dependent hydrolase